MECRLGRPHAFPISDTLWNLVVQRSYSALFVLLTLTKSVAGNHLFLFLRIGIEKIQSESRINLSSSKDKSNVFENNGAGIILRYYD